VKPKRKTITIATMMLAVLLSATSAGVGQDGNSGLQYPRNNVKGGAVSARRPGSWINRATSIQNKRHDTMLKDYGGATPISEDQVPASRREVMTIAFLDGLFTFLIDFVEQFQLAIQAARAAQALASGT